MKIVTLTYHNPGNGLLAHTRACLKLTLSEPVYITSRRMNTYVFQLEVYLSAGSSGWGSDLRFEIDVVVPGLDSNQLVILETYKFYDDIDIDTAIRDLVNRMITSSYQLPEVSTSNV